MSFLFDIDEKSEVAVRFISHVREQLIKGYLAFKKETNGSLQTIAEKIDGDRSAIHRQLNGEGNLTLRTVAELAWAFGKVASFELKAPEVESAELFSDFDSIRPTMAPYKIYKNASMLVEPIKDTFSDPAYDNNLMAA